MPDLCPLVQIKWVYCRCILRLQVCLTTSSTAKTETVTLRHPGNLKTKLASQDLILVRFSWTTTDFWSRQSRFFWASLRDFLTVWLTYSRFRKKCRLRNLFLQLFWQLFLCLCTSKVTQFFWQLFSSFCTSTFTIVFTIIFQFLYQKKNWKIIVKIIVKVNS